MAAFIVIAILMAVIAYFVAGQGLNTSSTSTYSNSARAGTIISQEAAIQGGFDLLLSKGIDPDAVRIDTSPGVGIYNVNAGNTVRQEIDPSAVANNWSSSGVWLYRGAALQNPGVGSGGSSYSLIVSGLTENTCLAINSILHNTSARPIIPVASASFRSSGASAGSPDDFSPAVSLSGNSAVKGWEKGCVVSTDNISIYFHVLLPQ